MAKFPNFLSFIQFLVKSSFSNVHDMYIILKQNVLGNLFLKLSKHKNHSLKSYELLMGYVLFAYCCLL